MESRRDIPPPPPAREAYRDPSARQIQRERLRLDYLPRPAREAVRAGDVIMDFCRKLETSTDFAMLRELQTDWTELAGPALSVHSWPARLERQTLTLCVENSTWLSEISRVEGPRLLRRLRSRSGPAGMAVKKFRLLVDAATVCRNRPEI